MNFTSDNCYGAAPGMLDALARANAGSDVSYGGDAITRRLNRQFAEIFERDVAVFPVISGTAANALSLSTLTPPHGAIFCHAQSHIAVDECGAVEMATHGARLIALDGDHGKLTPDRIAAAVAPIQKGVVHHAQPAAVSVTQATEFGTVYSPDEIAAIGKIAHANGMKLHLDGARFANALAHLKCAPADLSWRAGVDVMSFGATKNGALGAEAVVFFDPAAITDFEYRRKKSGHLLSKMRFVSAQLEAYLNDDLWIANASRANAMAARLAEGLLKVDGAVIEHPVEANAVFVTLPDRTKARLRKAGVQFYDWAPPKDRRTLIRLVTSFATPEEDVANFISIARG
ncbi:MAG TPA: low specificity L-threonine aldolase [Rhizomicrobium sp.]|nr:low specificity L-threonine aldolase [Rhizomicrobium sp.]